MLTAFPNKELALADLNKLKQTVHYINDESFKSKVDFYIRSMTESTVDLAVLEDFFNFNDRLDMSRNVKLADYVPELEKCRDYLKKPT